MALFSRLPLNSLIDLCRVLRHSLSAGLTLRDVFKQQARRGHAAVRPVATRISERLEEGESLDAALQPERHIFPPLFLALAGVGEHTGHEPETFGALEDYYLMQQRFRRQFWSQCTLPILQYIAAVFIISGMIAVLAYLGSPMDPLGLGLTGLLGALQFMIVMLGWPVALWFAYQGLSRWAEQKALVDRILLKVPAVGPVIEALTLARLSLALQLTLDSGMDIAKALGLSLMASANSAYSIKTKSIQERLRKGDSLTEAMAEANVFPDDFIHMLGVGEEGGRIPEMMRSQVKRYEEEAEIRLKVLTKAGGFAVWFFVACLITMAIFRMYGSYIGMLNSVSK